MRGSWMMLVLTLWVAAPVTAQERAEPQRSEALDTSAVVVTGAAWRLSQPASDILLPVRHEVAADAPAPALLAPSSRSRALMIAGAALFVAGILTDGDAGAVLMLAGAGVGAYGVYLHFR